MTKVEEIKSTFNSEYLNLFITSDLSVGVNELDCKNSNGDDWHSAAKHRSMSSRESSTGTQSEKQLCYGRSECEDFGKLKNRSKYYLRTHIPRSTFQIEEPDVNFKERGQWLTFNKNSPMLRRHSLSETENRRPVPRKRSVCSMTATPRKNKAESSKTDYITSFQRSLKLLGLQPKDFGLNSDNSSAATYTPPSRVGPTFRTRLTKRSYSAEDLKSVIQDHEGSIKGSGDHKTIANAVYEEWYFHKLDEARRRKDMEVANELNKKEHFEKVKIEQKQKAEENFIKWRELKKKQHQEWKQHQEKQQNGASGDFRFTNGTTRVKPNQEEVFLLWKREKDKLLKQKRLEEKIKEEKKSNSEKKASSDIAFRLWKSKSDEVLKEKALEKERKKQEKETQKEKEEERRESAKSSFIAWKKKKDAETRKKIIAEKKTEEKKKQEIAMREAERLYEAEQAFEEWLDQIEERRNKEAEVAHKQTQRSKHKFPWSPGGSAHW